MLGLLYLVVADVVSVDSGDSPQQMPGDAEPESSSSDIPELDKKKFKKPEKLIKKHWKVDRNYIDRCERCQWILRNIIERQQYAIGAGNPWGGSGGSGWGGIGGSGSGWGGIGGGGWGASPGQWRPWAGSGSGWGGIGGIGGGWGGMGGSGGEWGGIGGGRWPPGPCNVGHDMDDDMMDLQEDYPGRGADMDRDMDMQDSLLYRPF